MGEVIKTTLLSLGAMQREGHLDYFLGWGGWEPYLDSYKLDRVGVLFRLGHTYLINKHWFLNSNFEYARFRMTPKSLIDFNVLVGYKF